MKSKISASVIATLLLFLTTGAHANGSLQHFSQAVDNSARAVAHSSAASVKLVSGVVAVPLMIGGEIGKAGGDIGEALWDEANEPFPISDDVMTVGPNPAKAMQDREAE